MSPLSRTTTQKIKLKQFYKKFFKNKYGQSVWALGRGFKKTKKCRSSVERMYWMKDYEQIKIFIFEEFDHGSD